MSNTIHIYTQQELDDLINTRSNEELRVIVTISKEPALALFDLPPQWITFIFGGYGLNHALVCRSKVHVFEQARVYATESEIYAHDGCAIIADQSKVVAYDRPSIWAQRSEVFLMESFQGGIVPHDSRTQIHRLTTDHPDVITVLSKLSHL